MKIQIQIKIRKNAFTSPGSCLHEEQANALWSRREAASSPQNLSRVVGFLSQQIPGVASAPQKRSKKEIIKKICTSATASWELGSTLTTLRKLDHFLTACRT